MSIALSEFWTRMVRLGLADPDRCRTWATLYTEANAGSPPSDAVAIAKFLIAQNELTKFQAKGILSDEYRKIRLGNYVQRASETPPPPFSQWLEYQSVAKLESSATSIGFLLRLKSDPTAVAIHESLQRQVSVQSPHVQPVEVTSSNNRPALVFSSLAPGRSLHQLLTEKSSFSKNDVVALAVTLSGAVASFHEQQLVHGQIQADRVWMTAERTPTLLRSMMTRLEAQGSFDIAGATSMVWLDGDDFSEYYLAPEAAQQQATRSSDVYSLGCLLLRLVIGRRPFDGSDIASIRASHQNTLPPEVVESVSKGEAGDPLLRILAFAIAKNPQARFQDAMQLHRALEAVAKTYESKKPITVAEKTKAPATKVQASAVNSTTAAETPRERAKQLAVPTPVKAIASEVDAAALKAAPSEQKPTVVKVQSAKSETPKTKEAASPVPKELATSRPAKPVLKNTPDVSAEATTAKQPEPVGKVQLASVPQSAAPDEQTDVSAPASTVASSASTPTPSRRRRKKKSKAPLVLGGLGIGVLVLMISLLAGVGSKEEEVQPRPRPQLRIPPPSTVAQPSTQKSTGADAPSSANGFELVESDRLLWAPPHASETTAPPISLIPPGPGAIVSVQLKHVRESSAGKTLLQAFSPELSGLVDQAAQRAKVNADQIARCTIAMHPGRDGWPQVSLAIELTEPLPLKTLVQSWGVSEAKTPEGETIFAGDDVGQDAFYITPDTAVTNGADASVRRFAIGSLEQIQQVASIQGSTIALTPILAGLWKSSSETNSVTAIFSPNFLFTDARQLLDAVAPQLSDPLRRMWIPDVGAVMIAAEIDGERVYFESRMAPSGNVAAPNLMNSVRETLQTLPAWSENFIVSAVPDPSWRLLANRLPMMVNFAVDQTRFGVAEGNVVLNGYLPAEGFSQLTIASLLALNTPAGSAPMASQATTAEVLTVDQMLDRKMSISFDQESLEFAIAAVVAEFKRVLPSGNENPTVRILGGDLQKMGITQNQQIRDFRKNDVALRSVLTDLTLAANPDKTATSSHDPKQSLIWVVADDPESPGKKAILITTREAAAGKYELPPEFVAQ